MTTCSTVELLFKLTDLFVYFVVKHKKSDQVAECTNAALSSSRLELFKHSNGHTCQCMHLSLLSSPSLSPGEEGLFD